jgi:thioredoxin reductase (NADPH)
MAARVAGYGTEERLPTGTLVFEPGQRGVDFLLVVEGTIEIFDEDARGEAHVVRLHTEGEFTGELD